MKKILLILLSMLLFLPKTVSADGGLLPPDDYYVYETEQKAAIAKTDNLETLVITTSFEGDTEDFSWIVPTPSVPEVSKISSDFFDNLEEITIEDIYSAPSYSAMEFGLGDVQKEAVEVIEQKQLGYYDVTVLKSSDDEALYKWLDENNYTYPKEAKYVLDDYISRDWIFTAIKIRTDVLSDDDIQTNLNRGTISPVKFVFETDKMVYPMHISSIGKYYLESKNSFINGTGVLLYIFDKNKKTYTDFSIEYANWIKSDVIEKLATDDNGNSWLKPDNKMYLTKMYRYFEYSDMQNDLFIQDASDNDKVGVLPWYTLAYEWFLEHIFIVGVLLVLMFFIPMFWQFKKVSKACRTASWISQIVSFIILSLPLLFIIFSMLNIDTLQYIYADNESMLVLLYIKLPLLAMISIFIVQRYVQKKYLK